MIEENIGRTPRLEVGRNWYSLSYFSISSRSSIYWIPEEGENSEIREKYQRENVRRYLRKNNLPRRHERRIGCGLIEGIWDKQILERLKKEILSKIFSNILSENKSEEGDEHLSFHYSSSNAWTSNTWIVEERQKRKERRMLEGNCWNRTRGISVILSNISLGLGEGR